jgi:hypothetical protein
MLKKTLKLGISVAALSCLGLGAVAVSSVLNNRNELSVNAATTQTTRAIWAVDNSNTYWFVGSDLYVWTNSSTYITMTWVLSDYDGGLFYADIDSSVTSVYFSDTTDPTSNYQKTDTITINDATNDSLDNKVYWIGNNVGGGVCPITWGTAGMSNAQLGEVMSYYDTCNSSYSNGFNAYPLLNNSFYLASGEDGKDATIVRANTAASGNKVATTVGDKIALMGKLYNSDHGIS